MLKMANVKDFPTHFLPNCCIFAGGGDSNPSKIFTGVIMQKLNHVTVLKM